jgi:multifunctional methyltransferase subunit TRM112
MKLLAHNLLACVKCKHTPLLIRGDNVIVDEENEPNEAFLQRIRDRLDLAVLYAALASLGQPVPSYTNLSDMPDEELHRYIACIDVVDGALKCDQCECVYVIKNKIPHMVVRETLNPTS